MLEIDTENCRWSGKSLVKAEGNRVRGGSAESEYWKKSFSWEVAHELLPSLIHRSRRLQPGFASAAPQTRRTAGALGPSRERPQTYAGVKGGCSERSPAAQSRGARRGTAEPGGAGAQPLQAPCLPAQPRQRGWTHAGGRGPAIAPLGIPRPVPARWRLPRCLRCREPRAARAAPPLAALPPGGSGARGSGAQRPPRFRSSAGPAERGRRP